MKMKISKKQEIRMPTGFGFIIALVSHRVTEIHRGMKKSRHCEERSDEATQRVVAGLRLGCVVATLLAMTG